MIKKFICSLATVLCVIGATDATALSNKKMYIDIDDLFAKEQTFHIHTGDNIWLETNTVHKDEVGYYTYERNLSVIPGCSMGWERKWKCPYCYSYWPVGTPCQNADCPSKYR